MTQGPAPYRFTQLHIDVARNTTDDFNPFHDPLRWQRVRANPFGATIALGFQTAFLVSDLVERRHRGLRGDAPADGFVNYEFRFVGALRPDEPFGVALRKTVDNRHQGGNLSTRAAGRKGDATPVLIGTVSETATARFVADTGPADLPDLAALPDRQSLPGGRFFLKRKHLSTSNGKNFVLAGLGTQQDYFDELDERVAFPLLFPVALSSCAMLEQAWQQGYDFHADPVVYTSHQISVDRSLQWRLRSNDTLHLLVEGPLERNSDGTLPDQRGYRVYGLVHGDAILFRARLQLAALHVAVGA